MLKVLPISLRASSLSQSRKIVVSHLSATSQTRSMGYTTLFFGRFDLDKPLSEDHAAFLVRFNEIRHLVMKNFLMRTTPSARLSDYLSGLKANILWVVMRMEMVIILHRLSLACNANGVPRMTERALNGMGKKSFFTTRNGWSTLSIISSRFGAIRSTAKSHGAANVVRMLERSTSRTMLSKFCHRTYFKEKRVFPNLISTARNTVILLKIYYIELLHSHDIFMSHPC